MFCNGIFSENERALRMYSIRYLRATAAYNPSISLLAIVCALKGIRVVTSCSPKREVDDSEEQLAFIFRVEG
jgi:hypothetical protein